MRLHHFFERTADRTPQAIAVQDEDLALSYRELDERANRLAHHLRRRGVGGGHRVGILLHRSWLTYTALLAVLKAGATFVPIDPASPADRVAYIADDADLDLLLTTTDLLGSAEPLTAGERPRRVLPLDLAQDGIDAAPSTRPHLDLGGDPPAYVIYTSGSSGRPKGVEVAHSSICNFIDVVPAVYDVRPTDRVYQGMTISFDFSMEEIWPTFAVGATLVVGPNDSRRLGAELADFLDERGVTLFYCVPTLLATIPRDLPAIRMLYVGGEACPAGLVERWSRPGRPMLNTYGPTEATVTATWGELQPGKPVTIGRAMPTYSVVILDENRQPVPDGEDGEICIGGPGVANGYVGRPDLTADKFIRHELAVPNPDGSPGRLYRTGDLGRVDEHGEIVYLGRADDEVKIRGHRVDLGEIESLLLDDPEVESAVAALMNVGGAEELTAFITRGAGTDGTDALIARLHEQLRARVPDYMIPGYLEALPELPMMPSGKVDRKRLPAPSGKRLIATTGEVVAAEGEAEERVRAAWAEAFGLAPEDLSVTADFFTELGGHSLLAATAVSLMRERGVGNPAVRDLYANPTVRGLAALLDASEEAPAAALPPRSEPVEHRGRRVAASGLVQAAFLFALMLIMTLPVAAVYDAHDGRVSLTVLGQLAAVATGVYLGLRWVLAPLMVRMLATGVRPGRYRLWGRTYLQLWAMELALAMSPLPALSGSPLMSSYLRLLGARVGPRAHIGTSTISLPALLSVGDDATVNYNVSIRPWVVQDGWVIVEPVMIGDGAYVGANAALESGAVVGDRAMLGKQSTAGEGQVIPAGEKWAGSPSAPAEPDAELAAMGAAAPAPDWTRGQRAGVLAGLALLEAITIATLLPSVLLVWGALLVFGEGVGLAAAALVGPVFVVSVSVAVALGRKAVLRRTPVGVFPARSALGIRKWIADKLLEMSLTHTNALYATLYTVPWLRMLGAKVARNAEVSTAAHLDPDLLTLGEGSFVADMAGVGAATFRNGRVALQRTEVGDRAFVGNAALVPAGTRLGDGSLVGVQTVPPADGVPTGSSWLGSPAINLPVRQDSGDFDERLTFRPGRGRIAERLLIEFFRVALPASLIAVVLYLYLLALSAVARASDLPATAFAAPGLALLTGGLLVGAVLIVKWLVVGAYRPRVEPLWSRFVRRSEFVTGLYEAAAVPGLLFMLVGTPFLPVALRLFGARIGRRTWIATTYLTEFDLVEIGDDAMVGRDVSLQTHLFEDRVMKMSTVRIGAGATVGDRGIVLYDATVGPRAALEPLSLVMKGEQLPASTRWRGIPAEGVAA